MAKAKSQKPGEVTYFSANEMQQIEFQSSLPKAVNTSGFAPLEYKVLIKLDPEKEKTAGGIYIPDETKEREQNAAVEGEVIALSPAAFSYEDWQDGTPLPQPGDRVVFAKFSGFALDGDDGGKYRIVNDKDIIALRTGK